MQVFLTSHRPLTKERKYFEELTKLSLQLNGFKPIIIRKKMLERYFEAERLATSPIYIVCDNDIVLSTPDILIKMKKIMQKHPKLSILGCGWGNMQNEEKSPWRLGTISDDVWEWHSVGGCLAIRKGTIKDLGLKMEFKNYGDDRVLGDTARAWGYKVGVAHKLKMYHLGMGNEHTTFKQTDTTKTSKKGK